MVNVNVNGKNYSVKEGSTVLQACLDNGIYIPTLCYLKDINEIGACRICVVEVVGQEKLVASCNTEVYEGMQVITDSEKVKEARKITLELILSNHNKDCENCVRNNNCPLQKLTVEYGVYDERFTKSLVKDNWDYSLPLNKDVNKCIKCMRCISTCEKVQSLGIWDVINTGSRTAVGLKNANKLTETDCVYCGQCITHCPTAALKERDDTNYVKYALENKDIITVAQIAPAVRSAFGEALGIAREDATAEKLVDALKKMGFDYVFDTNFAADLTIMEEASEFIERLPEIKKSGLPMFTSCCPGWVRFLKAKYPEFLGCLSTAKSPQQMFGAITKSYFADKIGADSKKVFCVSIMPCLAKKKECKYSTMKNSTGDFDVDASLTVREVCRMIEKSGIKASELVNRKFDSPLGTGTGAAVIFGETGGVMQAALRSAYYFITGKNPSTEDFISLSEDKGIKTAKINIQGKEINVAVVNGLSNADKLLSDIKRNKISLDFVEVMACPGGCVGGGGQPIKEGVELYNERKKVLAKLDSQSTLRYSHENPEIVKCYKEFLDKPLSSKSHELLHTDHNGWKMSDK